MVASREISWHFDVTVAFIEGFRAMYINAFYASFVGDVSKRTAPSTMSQAPSSPDAIIAAFQVEYVVS